MTGPGWLALGGIALVQGAEILAGLLNLGRLAGAPDRVRAYHARSTLLESTHALVFLNVLAGFWIAGGFGWLEARIAVHVPHPVVSGLLFFGALGLAMELIALPFRVVRTFGLEREFGFNRTSPGLFAMDFLRSLTLSSLIGGGLIAAVLALLAQFGPDAWPAAWAAGSALVVLLAVLAPLVILPLFNRFEPLPDSPLRDATADLCRRAGFAVSGIYRMDGSRRSSRANAFFVGFGPTRRVALFDTLLQHHPEPEVLAVVAHELGHCKRGHVKIRMLWMLAVGGLLLWTGALAVETGHAARVVGVPGSPSPGLQILGAALVLAPVAWALSIAGLASARRQEFEADAYAADALSDPGPICAALGRLATDNLAHPDPHPFAVILGASHPPIPVRIARVQSARA